MLGGATGIEVVNIKSGPTKSLGRRWRGGADVARPETPWEPKKTSLTIHTGSVKTCMKSKR